MKKYSAETLVGVFVFIGLVCVGYLTVKLGKMEIIGSDHYILHARFESVSGLKVTNVVEMAGVKIGQVDGISLDPEEQVAVVTLKIRKDVVITDDAIASVKTAGLIGDKFIKITPGGSDVALKPGEVITDTESPIDIEDLIGKYVFGEV